MSAKPDGKPKSSTPKEANTKKEEEHTTCAKPAEEIDSENKTILLDGKLIDAVTVVIPEPVICGVPTEEPMMLPPPQNIDEMFAAAEVAEEANISPPTGSQPKTVAGPEAHPEGRS